MPEAEEQISELEDKMVEITSEEQNKVKRMKRTEDSLRHLWGNVKCANIQIIGVPEEEEKKNGHEKIFEEVNFQMFKLVLEKAEEPEIKWPTSTGEGNGNPFQYSCLENPRDRGAWWTAVYGITQSWTQLK